MDKVSNVNFTGLSNIGYVKFRRGINHARSISMVLKDDYKGKDLEQFKNVVRKVSVKTGDYLNDVSSDVLNIECINSEIGNHVFVNGKYLHANDKNLPMFSYIAKITRQIENMKHSDMVVNNDYKEFMADDVLISGAKLSDSMPEGFSLRSLDFLFNKEYVKKGAETINSFVQDVMDVFLGIK